MHDEDLRHGDAVTIRSGAPLPPNGQRRLVKGCRGKVTEVHGRRVTVDVGTELVEDDEGSKRRAPFLTFDRSYVIRMDSC